MLYGVSTVCIACLINTHQTPPRRSEDKSSILPLFCLLRQISSSFSSSSAALLELFLLTVCQFLFYHSVGRRTLGAKALQKSSASTGLLLPYLIVLGLLRDRPRRRLSNISHTKQMDFCAPMTIFVMLFLSHPYQLLTLADSGH